MQCNFIKNNGGRCNSNALKGDEFCFVHSNDPEIVKIREKVLSEGGKNSRKQYQPIVDEITIEDTNGVVQMIRKLIQEIRQDEISTKKANAIGYLLNIGLRALQQSNIEDRLKDIEDVLSNRP